jgi:hypothetical protein
VRRQDPGTSSAPASLSRPIAIAQSGSSPYGSVMSTVTSSNPSTTVVRGCSPRTTAECKSTSCSSGRKRPGAWRRSVRSNLPEPTPGTPRRTRSPAPQGLADAQMSAAPDGCAKLLLSGRVSTMSAPRLRNGGSRWAPSSATRR